MKVIGVIPARYKSTRFEGKPLADICGKPMIWWVYNQAKKVKELNDIFIATDDERIEKVCKELDLKVIMTSNEHFTPTDRIYEVSTMIHSDIYVCINGDEPLINPNTIRSIIPESVNLDEEFVANIITEIKDPVEVIDFTNLKVVTDSNGKGIYISRSPIPYPKGSMECIYKKHVGVVAFNSKALQFYVNTKRGDIEKIEDIDLLRFIENHKEVNFIEDSCDTLSVDTPKDLHRVIKIMEKMNQY